MMINLGNNFNSKLEVVSGLNVFNYAPGMFYYANGSYISKYAPKLYLGTPKTVGNNWLKHVEKGVTLPTNSWPKNYQQGPQKGEANSCNNNLVILKCIFYYIFI